MNSSTIISLTAVGVSIVAVLASALFSAKQARLMRKSNHMPAIVQLSEDLRTPAFHDAYDYVVSRLLDEHDPSLGLSGLPPQARDDVVNVAYYYQTFAVLLRLEILDRDAVMPMIHYRVVSIWKAIAPFVEAERTAKGPSGIHILGLLQGLAAEANQYTPQAISLALGFGKILPANPFSAATRSD